MVDKTLDEINASTARHDKIEDCIIFLCLIWDCPEYKTYEGIIGYLKDSIPRLEVYDWEGEKDLCHIGNK